MSSSSHFNRIASKFDQKSFQELNVTMSLEEYHEMVLDNPLLVRTAYQRIYDMIMAKGVETFERHRKKISRFNFFHDTKMKDYIVGLEEYLEQLVKAFRGAAGFYGTEKRVLLLHGPVGSSKSTLCKLLKAGLEEYTATDEGAIYTFEWVDLPNSLDLQKNNPCPLHDDPLKLFPLYMRQEIEKDLNEIMLSRYEAAQKESDVPLEAPLHKISLAGELNPSCQFYMDRLLEMYKGDWLKVVTTHIRVHRFVFSEARRIGIGTFQPKDEKNQDATELTGDINFMKLGHFGSDSDPRAFSFDGEFEVAHRGLLEWIEILKLDKAFLYDLLGAAQERQVKPKKFPQVDIDICLLGHTNNPEYQKLQQDDTMEALRDRVIRIDMPYVLRKSDELKILEKDFGPHKIRQHIAPHTLEVAALWSVLTRLDLDKDHNIDLVEKAKLYDGKILEGWTEEKVRELIDKYDEGFKGISVRYVQNKISDALVERHDYINPFMVLNNLESGLKTYTLIKNEEDRDRFRACIDLAKKELGEILKREVQAALCADENAIVRMCANYIDNVFAFINESKIQDPYTLDDVDPDEQLMRSIEEKIDIPERNAPDFRRSIAAMVGDLSQKAGKAREAKDPDWERYNFKWDSNIKLRRALELKLFDDTRDTIKLSALNLKATAVVDPDMQEKIDQIKTRLIRDYGYNEQSATDVLNFVGSIFARGDIVEG